MLVNIIVRMLACTVDRPLWALQMSYDIWHNKPVGGKGKNKGDDVKKVESECEDTQHACEFLFGKVVKLW